ncbi:unnamed protein product [Rotaria sordida]|uniref:Uncharacterized protein n=1 Tax=Rotaria sordida TaxID=392033 RepID=A0A815EHZ4_9BILA|nr:unnamed protein product [Rotaria sordida]CAF1169872.1 unnamed protein product [Rotaria sordida]CAF1249603.1 unnamed protein product [Rotaria sordida]CAF1311692.1 unnamed protein product [Rotaria sordida]CAF1531242.1 unnamed protein product [Rotaria sordida]
MSSKSKKVTYKHPIDENTDYLVPLKSDYNLSIPIKVKFSETTSLPPPLPPTSNGFFSSIYFVISLLIYVTIPITQFVIGLIYIGQCPVQQMIVVWMIASGISGILLAIIGIIIHIKVRKQSSPSSPYDDHQSYPLIIRILMPIFILILLFIVVWFFVGQVYVFEVKLRVEFFDPTLPEYCHENLYKAAYILIFIDYLIFLLVIILNVLSYVAPPDENHSSNHEKPHQIHNIRT